MNKVTDNNNCFACGTKNPIGLKINFNNNYDGVRADIILDKNYQGWKDVVHGGIISTILDEAMVKSAFKEGLRCVTAEIKVKFKMPCYTGRKYRLTGRVVEQLRRVVIAEAILEDSSGKLIATGLGKLFKIELDE